MPQAGIKRISKGDRSILDQVCNLVGPVRTAQHLTRKFYLEEARIRRCTYSDASAVHLCSVQPQKGPLILVMFGIGYNKPTARKSE